MIAARYVLWKGKNACVPGNVFKCHDNSARAILCTLVATRIRFALPKIRVPYD